MDLQIRLGNDLLNELSEQLEDFGLQDSEHKAHIIMHIIARNTTPQGEN